MVLAAKPHQENMPWHEYQWRLFVSDQKLNHITQPFSLTKPLFYDEVQDIYTEVKYFIAVDMDIGYWQVLAEEEV